jgi:hypothetical protein
MEDVFSGVLLPGVWLFKHIWRDYETFKVKIKHDIYQLIRHYEMYKNFKKFQTKYETVALEK